MQYQKPVLVQGQHLKMNPQLYQSIQLMALPLQELKFRLALVGQPQYPQGQTAEMLQQMPGRNSVFQTELSLGNYRLLNKKIQ